MLGFQTTPTGIDKLGWNSIIYNANTSISASLFLTQNLKKVQLCGNEFQNFLFLFFTDYEQLK